MNILIMTQWFDPEPTFKGLVFAKALQARGHHVQVITGFPNYPGGKIYQGYRLRWFQRESIDGVEVCRVPLYPSHDGSALGRAWNYISFAITSFLFALFFARKADVIYAYHPPLTVGLSAACAGFLRRTPVVYDIQDMWPDTLKATGMLNNERALALIGAVCRWVYRRAAKLVVLSPGFEKILLDRGVPSHKIELIYNWCDEVALQKPAAAAVPVQMQQYFNVVFAGTMGKAQSLTTVIEAAEKISSTQPTVQFVFVGGGVDLDHLKSVVDDKKLTNVIFLPRMPMNEVSQVLYAADVLLVHLCDDPLFAITVPSKTQAYMAVGKPIVMAVRGDAADLVYRADCGVVIEPQKPQVLADAIAQLVQMPVQTRTQMGVRGAAYYRDHLSLDQGVAQFIRVFESVIPPLK